MKSKITSVFISLLVAFGLWLYVITVVSPNSEQTYMAHEWKSTAAPLYGTFQKALENGDIAYALFNMKDEERIESVGLGPVSAVRDVWMQENAPASSNLVCKLKPHGVRIFRVTPA